MNARSSSTWRLHELGAEHGLARHELVGAVLRAGTEAATHAGRAQELADVLLAEGGERRRVADVRGHGVGAVFSSDRGQSLGDESRRIVPTGVGPRAVGGPQRRAVETIRVMVEVDHRQALATREPLRHRMLPVRRELDEPAVFDVRLESTRRFADAAEGLDRRHALVSPGRSTWCR